MRTALHFYLSSELLSLLWAILLGGVLAIVYRLFSLIRFAFGAGKVLTFALDLLTVFSSVILLFLYGFLFLEGEVRLYALTAAALGFLLFRIGEKYFSKMIKKLFHFGNHSCIM